MNTFRIMEPPSARMCSTTTCHQTATLRVITPEAGPDVLDLCYLCWPRFRANLAENGHEIIDTTGDMDTLVAGYPGARRSAVTRESCTSPSPSPVHPVA